MLTGTSDFNEALTPREARLERAAAGLRALAVLNGLLVLLLTLAGGGAAITEARGIFEALRSLLLAGVNEPADTALVMALLLVMVNAAGVLVLMVGVLAQEGWTLVLGLFYGLGNAWLLLALGFTPALLAFAALGWLAYCLLPDLGAFRANPVMLKELRERMRGARAFAVITVYLALMSAFTILLFLANSPLTQGLTSSATGNLGRILFQGVVGLELMLIIFIAPAFTAGAVTGERERKTYDLLQITLLPRPSFVIGKLESALGYILLLLLAAIPLQSIAFLFGGVTETELILSFVLLIVTAITFGTVGLFFSTVTERTLTASVRAYSLALIVLVGVPVLSSLFVGYFNAALVGGGTNFSGSPVVEAGLIYLGALFISLNPITTAVATQTLLIQRQEVGFWSATLNSNGSTIPLVSPWISFTVFALVISTVLIVLSIRRMRTLQED